MTDIVERLRLSVTKGHEPTDEDVLDAADEIERLRAWKEEHAYSEVDMDMHVEAVTKELKDEIERLRAKLAETSYFLRCLPRRPDWKLPE